MSRGVRVVAVAAALSALSGCALFGGLLKGGIQKPQVSVLSAAPTSADFESVTVAVDLRVANPNPIGLRVRGLAWSLDVEGGRVASGDAPGGLTLPASGAATSRVTARVRFADLANLAKLAEGKEKVAFKVAGKVAVETPIGPVDVSWAHAGDLPVPRLPHIALEGVRMGRQSFTETEVILKLRLQNPNGFPLPAASAKLDVELGGERVAQAASQPIPAVRSGEEATIELPVKLSLLGAGRALMEARGRPVQVAVRGTVGFGWMQLPVDVRTELRLP